MEKSDIGLIGIAVMGENLALNLERQGWKVSVWNRTLPGIEEGMVERFMEGRANGKNIVGFKDINDFVDSLKNPRIILIMVRAGHPVDDVLEMLKALLSQGDVLIDGGNSNYLDTERRVKQLREKGIHFIGAGISGGEEGALNGASIMPGGAIEGWETAKPILQSIAARDENGIPCCEWVGKGGAGHYVKMVHNGIEYGDMQLIAETYSILRSLTDFTNEQMSEIFYHWNQRKLRSYLIEITAHILAYKDKFGLYSIDHILDVAGQKGMGKWSVISALELEMPLGVTAAAIFERNLSLEKTVREKASQIFHREEMHALYHTEELTEFLYQSLYLSRLVSYSQGINLMNKASHTYEWELNLSVITRLWNNGCVIRSETLKEIGNLLEQKPDTHLWLNPFFTQEIKEILPAWKKIIEIAVKEEISTPAFASALNYFYSFSTENLPINLIQAQRDYFGAHTFERTDSLRGEFFHENWTDQESMNSSGIYNA